MGSANQQHCTRPTWRKSAPKTTADQPDRWSSQSDDGQIHGLCLPGNSSEPKVLFGLFPLLPDLLLSHDAFRRTARVRRLDGIEIGFLSAAALSFMALLVSVAVLLIG
jgi:hypothetical protein